MSGDLDLFRAASILIEHYGVDAEEEARRRADEWRAKGNKTGFDIWIAIERAMRDVRDLTPHRQTSH